MSTDPGYEDAAFEAEMRVVEALADEAMAPWNDRLTPAQRARIRDVLIEALATHPNVADLVAQLATSPDIQISGEVGEAASALAKDVVGRGGGAK